MIEWALLEPMGVLTTDIHAVDDYVHIEWKAMYGVARRVVFKNKILMAYIFHERVSTGGDLTLKMYLP